LPSNIVPLSKSEPAPSCCLSESHGATTPTTSAALRRAGAQRIAEGGPLGDGLEAAPSKSPHAGDTRGVWRTSWWWKTNGTFKRCSGPACAGLATRLSALDGREVLQLAREQSPDVILDLMLPEISGFEVCKALKGDPKAQGSPSSFSPPGATRGNASAARSRRRGLRHSRSASRSCSLRIDAILWRVKGGISGLHLIEFGHLRIDHEARGRGSAGGRSSSPPSSSSCC
jgi:CheY-like chemotaxis protein